MARNLRLGYTVKLAFFLLSAAAPTLAIPTGKIQTKNKRQSGSISSSLKDSIEDAVDLDKHTKEKNDSESNNNDNDRVYIVRYCVTPKIYIYLPERVKMKC